MSVFKDAWEHLDTLDFNCINEGSSLLNHWGVSLGIYVVFSLLAHTTLIIRRKKVQEINSDDGREKRNGKDDWADIKACGEQKRELLGLLIEYMSVTCRKNPFMHCYATFGAIHGFALLLVLFQRFPQSQLAPLAFIMYNSAHIGCLFYYAMIARSPVANVDDKEYYMYSPRNVYQDLSAPFIHPLAIFCIQFLLAIIYILAVFDEKFPPCINDTAAYSLYSIAAILKALYYGVDWFHNMRNSHDDRKLWTQSYEKLFPEGGEAEYKLAWGSSPPMVGNITKWQWYVRSIFDVFVNGVIYTVINYFMVIQSANGDLRDFVLNFVAAEFILRLDDYSTFGYEGCFCIVKSEGDPPDKLPTTAVEGALDEMELRFKRENEEKNKAMELRFKEKKETMRLNFKGKNEAMELRFKEKNEQTDLLIEEKNKQTDLRFEEMNKMISNLQEKMR